MATRSKQTAISELDLAALTFCPIGTRQWPAMVGDRVTHWLQEGAIRHSSAAGHGGGWSHSHATKAGHRAPVSSRPRRGVEKLTRYESGPSGTRQQQVTAGDRVTHSLRKQAIGRQSAAGHSGESSHSQATNAGHRAFISGRPQRGIESLTPYERRPSGTYQRQATLGDRVTHNLRKQAIGHPSAAGNSGGSSHSLAMKVGRRASVSGRPRRGI